MFHFIHDLDKNNFFYSSIVTLAQTQFGVNELFSRGLFIQLQHEFPNRSAFVRHVKTYKFPEEVEHEIFRTRTFTPKIFVPGFTTKDKQTTYQMEPDTSAVRFYQENQGITNANIELTYMTILVAWEKVAGLSLTDSAVYQFFRHVRNAAAHNGKFYFTNNVIDNQTKQLKQKAKWKDFEILASMQKYAVNRK